MNIVIDSSIYAKDIQFKSESLLNIIQLGQLGYINLYIPNTVMKERITNEDQGIKDKISSIKSNLKDLEKHGILGNEISHIEFRTFWFEKYYAEDLRTKWDYFIGKSRATVLEYPSNIGDNVMKAYFDGKNPFQVRKNRKDIPDSFIYEEIKNLIKEVKPLTFVSADNNLRIAVDKFEDIKTYSELTHLLNSPELKEGLLKIDELREEDSKWIEFLKERKDTHVEFVKDNLAKNIVNELFESFQIYSNFKDIRVVEVDKIQSVNISYDRFINLLDSDFISVPAKAHIIGIIKFHLIPNDGTEPYESLREIVFDAFFNLDFKKDGEKINAKPEELSYIILKH